jgi:phosphoribosylanthranilate isomerase
MSNRGIWIKICGNTSPEDALLACDAGADAVGFVFAPSPRRVTVEQVAEIVPLLPAAVEKIGVFVDAAPAEIADAVERCGLTGVQLHAGVDASHPAMLRKDLGPALRILRVVHFSADFEIAARIAEEIAGCGRDLHVDAVLVDSRTATAVGGTGIRFDWQAAHAAIFSIETKLKLIVAGGLTPANVAEAISTLRPWGVDVASGVETAPGRKDPAKVREFIANARVRS